MSYVNRRRRLAKRSLPVTLLACVFLGLTSPVARSFDRSPDRASALLQLAESKPCAAAALIYIALLDDSARTGIFYLPEVPSVHAIERLFKEGAEKDFALQTNLYSDISVYVEVRWSVQQLNADAKIVTSEAHLVDASGPQLNHLHSIESATRVIVTGETLRVLESQADR